LMIQVKDLSGKYILINKKLKETFSYREEQLLGNTDYQLTPDKAAEYEKTDKEVIDKGKPVEIDETVVLQDQPRHFHYVKFPLRDPSGHIFAV